MHAVVVRYFSGWRISRASVGVSSSSNRTTKSIMAMIFAFSLSGLSFNAAFATPVTLTIAEYLELNERAQNGISEEEFVELHRTGFTVSCDADDDWEIGGTGLGDCASALARLNDDYRSRVPEALPGTRGGGEPIEEGGTGMLPPNWFYASTVGLFILGWIVFGVPSMVASNAASALARPRNVLGSFVGATIALMILAGITGTKTIFQSYFRQSILASYEIEDALPEFDQLALVLSVPPLLR